MQYRRLPETSVTATNPSVGINNDTAPANSTQIAGKSGTTLVPVSVDGSGRINTNVVSSALPTGAATAANQTTGNTSLSSIDTAISALNLRLPGGLVPARFDEIALTYVAAGNGVGQVQTATYKLASSTIATLTLTYDASNRLASVVKA